MRRTRPIERIGWALVLLSLSAAGCRDEGACAGADLSAPARPAAYAVVSSDYFSTAIALLDEEGALLDEAFIDSGVAPTGVVAPLNGDVVLPSEPIAPCVLTLIDRFPTDVLTFLDVCRGEVLGQLDVGAGGRPSNPHDVIGLGGDRALVSRHDPSEGGGNDLLVVDWRRARALSRIDLSTLDVEVDAQDPSGGEARVRAYARPSRMVRLVSGETERVIVGLARLDASFHVAGPGAVALVDVDAGVAEAVALEGLVGCDEVDAVPGEPSLAVVTCGGPAFTDERGRREETGAAMLALEEDGSVTVRAAWRAADHPEQPVYNTWTVPLDAERVVIVAMGDFGLDLDDRVGVLAMGGAQSAPLLMEASDAFVIGDGAYDAERGLLLLPDADLGAVRRFARDGDAFTELEPVDTAGCRGLVPREIRRLTPP